MRKVVIALLLLLFFIITGCKGCLNQLYSVHEEQTSINVIFEADKDIISLIKRSIDSTRKEIRGCKYPGLKIESNDKIICLETPCECFLVHFNFEQISIQAIYCPAIGEAWLTKREMIKSDNLDRLSKRFQLEVINKYSSP